MSVLFRSKDASKRDCGCLPCLIIPNMKEFERHVTHPQASTSQILDVSNGIYGLFKFPSQKLFFPQHMYSVLDEAKCMIWKEFTRCDSEQRSDTLSKFELQPQTDFS